MLTDEEREALVKYRIEKAYEMLVEARDCAKINHSKDEAKLLARLQNMRMTGDYDDFIDWDKEEVEPLFSKVEDYINKIKVLVEQK